MNTNSRKGACVADIVDTMEAVAPAQLAEEWDNCGLQVGHAAWPVRKIWVSLDPLLQVAQAAAKNQVDLLICHHPLIFKPLNRIDLDTSVGAIIDVALRHQMAIFSAHTNLDSAAGGINDLLANKIGLTHLTELAAPGFWADEGPDETGSQPLGLGRVGKLDPATSTADLVRKIKKVFKLKRVKVAGNQQRQARTVAVCSGSGGSLMKAFLDSGADVFISGDLKYHDARLAEDAGRCIIDLGHFASEHLVVAPLVRQLRSMAEARDWDIRIEACTLEKDPFDLL